MNKSDLLTTIFITAVCDSDDKAAARLMIQSLRDFGGPYSRAPFWLFDFDEEVNTTSWEALSAERFRGELPHDLKGHLFGQKVSACAQAEAMTDGHTRSLVWIDPCCLITRPPALYDLDDAVDAAFRPVHIRNVGLLREDPVNPYWQRILSEVGVDDLPGEVVSFVDQQHLRPYFNTHGFAVNPRLGLMKRWKALFTNLCRDDEFQKGVCAAKREQIFLFQALLSALVVASIPSNRLRMLPPNYNYPYNLQDHLPGERRAATFNSLTMFTYEELSVDPDKVHNIAIEEPLLSWLKKQIK